MAWTISGASSVSRSTRLRYEGLILSALASSAQLAQTSSSMSLRQRNPRAIRLDQRAVDLRLPWRPIGGASGRDNLLSSTVPAHRE
jgi:hypothetical protein